MEYTKKDGMIKMDYIKIILDLFRIAMLFTMVWALMINYNITHEDVHVQIYTHDGCKDVYVNIDYTLGAMEGSYTKCMDTDYIMSVEAYQLNMQNEIVGYNVMALIMAMLGSIAILKWC